jgi:hypothetical protein
MKKTRLLEIIREEISLTLREGEMEEKAAKAAQLKATDLEIKALQKKKAELTKTGVAESEELNETPIYDISDMEGFKSTLNKFRDENTSKSKALNLLLTKLEDEGTVDTNQLSKDMGVDTATFNNQEIRKFLNRPADEYFENPKTGKELPDFTPFLSKSDKKRGKVAGEKSQTSEPKTEKPKTAEPKATNKPAVEPKKATLTKGDDGFDKVSYSEPKEEKPKTEKPKSSETDKATSAASKTPKLDKLSKDKDALLNTQKEIQTKMRELATKVRGAEASERENLTKELKNLNKLNGEIQAKLSNLF